MTEHITYQLEKISDISKSEAIHEKLESFLNSGSEIRIDASQVERIDTAVLQMLISLNKTLEKQHLIAPIINPSDSFLSTVKLMGVLKHLKIEQ